MLVRKQAVVCFFFFKRWFLGQGPVAMSMVGLAHLYVHPLFGQDCEDWFPGVVLRTRAIPFQEVWKCQSAAVPLRQAAAGAGGELRLSR